METEETTEDLGDGGGGYGHSCGGTAIDIRGQVSDQDGGGSGGEGGGGTGHGRPLRPKPDDG